MFMGDGSQEAETAVVVKPNGPLVKGGYGQAQRRAGEVLSGISHAGLQKILPTALSAKLGMQTKTNIQPAFFIRFRLHRRDPRRFSEAVRIARYYRPIPKAAAKR